MSDCGECNEHRVNLGNPWARCPACRKTAEIARLRADRDAWMRRFKEFERRAVDQTLENAKLRAEVERLNIEAGALRAGIEARESRIATLTQERDEAVGSLDRVCRDVLVALAGYVGTPAEGYRKAGLNWIAADIEEARKKGESAEAQVAELEAVLRPFADACRPGGFGNAVSMHHWQQARALFSTKPAPIPDLLAEVLPPKCWHCSYIGTVVMKYCMRDGCPETPREEGAV